MVATQAHKFNTNPTAPTAADDPPAPTRARGTGTSTPALATKENYDLTAILTDFAQARVPYTDFVNDVIIPIAQLYRQGTPTTPYLTVGGAATTQITQYTHALLSFFVQKGIAYLLSKDVTVRVPGDRNPRSAAADRALCENLIRTTWRWNDERVPGLNSLYRRLELIFLEGGYAAQYSYLNPADKDAINDGYPLSLTLHSLTDLVFQRDPMGEIRRVIVGKKRLASELPAAWAANYDPGQEVDVYEHWDRIDHGVVINGADVVKPLTPHGYVNRLGMPICPWVIAQHDPREYIRGNTDPVASGLTPLKTLLGRPVVEKLVPIVQDLSYINTLLRYTLTEAALPVKEIRGNVKYDAATRAFLVSGDKPNNGVDYPNNAQNLSALLNAGEYFHNIAQVGGLADGLMTGQGTEGESGVAQQGSTSMAKSLLDSAQRTLETYLAQEGKMQLAMVASNTAPSTAQLYQRTYNRPLPAKNPQESHNYTNGQPMPLSEIVTGDPDVQISSANMDGINVVVCQLTPYDKLPAQQLFQAGMAIWQNPNNPLSDEEILETYLGYDDPREAIRQGRVAKVLKDPSLPFGDLDALDAMVHDYADKLPPGMQDQLHQQIQQTWLQSFQLAVTTKLQAIQQGAMPGSPSQQPPQPGGPPPGGGPPGGGGGNAVPQGMPGGAPPGPPPPPGAPIGAQQPIPLMAPSGPAMPGGPPVPQGPPQGV